MIHADDAREAAISVLEAWLGKYSDASVVLLEDVAARLRVLYWHATPENASELDPLLQAACGAFWTNQLVNAGKANRADQFIYDQARDRGVELKPRLILTQRFRSKSAWFQPIRDSAWIGSPYLVGFYGYKGGVGRTTALISAAAQAVQTGKRVALVDLDLEAPGLASLFEQHHPIARWGVIDYLIERPGIADLEDYYTTISLPEISEAGEIYLFHAGLLDANYLEKLARADIEGADAKFEPLLSLLTSIKDKLAPDVIMVDLRAGLSEAGGFLVSGLMQVHVLVGTSSEQSWLGLSKVIERLGKQRYRQGKIQGDVIVLQGLVPTEPESRAISLRRFVDRSAALFDDLFYLDDSDDQRLGENYWVLSDAGAPDSPDTPISLSFNGRLAQYGSVADVLPDLVSLVDFQQLYGRIASRFEAHE